VGLSGTLYLPAGYDKVKRKVALIWAYPTEYKQNSAGQNDQNPNEFTFPYYGSFVYWATRICGARRCFFPIIGEGTTEPNDNFITQLVDNGRLQLMLLMP
jgi:hypothetical protein